MKLSRLLLEKAGNSKVINVGYGMFKIKFGKRKHILISPEVDVVTVYLPNSASVEFLPKGNGKYRVKYTIGHTFDMGILTLNNGKLVYKRGNYTPSYITSYDVKRAVKLMESIISKRSNNTEKEVVCNGWL